MADPKTTAGMNQVFICRACARAFRDRAATFPIEIDLPAQVVQQIVMVPHPRYPDDAELAQKTYVDAFNVDVKIVGREAVECCAANTGLCSSTRLRFRNIDGAIEIVGAEYLE